MSARSTVKENSKTKRDQIHTLQYCFELINYKYYGLYSNEKN